MVIHLYVLTTIGGLNRQSDQKTLWQTIHPDREAPESVWKMTHCRDVPVLERGIKAKSRTSNPIPILSEQNPGQGAIERNPEIPEISGSSGIGRVARLGIIEDQRRKPSHPSTSTCRRK